MSSKQQKSLSQFEAELIGRTRAARERNFKSAARFAKDVMEIPQPTYANYETDRPIPHQYLWKFCAVCDVSIEWLLTGHGDGPAWEAYVHQPKSRQSAPRKRKQA